MSAVYKDYAQNVSLVLGKYDGGKSSDFKYSQKAK